MTASSAAALSAIVLAVASCGPDREVVVVPSAELPFPVSRTASPTPPGADPVTHPIFFVRDGRLVEAPRTLQVADSIEEAVIQLLIEGPTEDEVARGLATAIPVNARVLQVTVSDRVAAVDLSSEFQSPAPPDEVLLRVAQVVWTLVVFPGIDAVRFTIDGIPQAVVTDGGDVVDRPVIASDYASVAPEHGDPDPAIAA